MSAGLPPAVRLRALEWELDEDVRKASWVVRYTVIIAERYTSIAVQSRGSHVGADTFLDLCVRV